MPRLSVAEREKTKFWQTRILQADTAYEQWEKKYQCKKLHEYYLGHQWEDQKTREDNRNAPYTINLFFPSIETRRPSLVFNRPRIRLMARPSREDDPASTIASRLRLLEDTANTLLADRRSTFLFQAQLAVQDSFFRFGVLEVGYSADLVDNPNAETPILDRTGKSIEDENGQVLKEPAKIIREESIYFKRIPASQFRVSLSSNNLLSRNDWCGYYEWVHYADIKANTRYAHRDEIKPGGKVSSQYDVPDPASYYSEETERHRGMCKLWKTWDIREMRRYVLDGTFNYILFEEDFEFLPFPVLKLHEILDEFYPLPPAYNWISPQDELNETRQAQKIHRRRFYRRYMRDPRFSEDEWDKIETGGDGVCALVPNPEGAVVAIPNAEMDRSSYMALPASKEDFMQVSGITGEQRGVQEAETATQASIIDINARVRETFQRTQVADWIVEAVTIMLKTLIRRMALPFWIRTNVDPTSPGGPAEAQEVEETWKLITHADLPQDFNWEVSVDIETLSPATEDRQRMQFIQAMQMLQSPMSMILMRSDVLLRKFLHLFGVRNEKEIQEVRRAMGEALAMQQALAQAAETQGGPGRRPNGPGIPPPPAPGPMPDLESMIGQLASQVPGR